MINVSSISGSRVDNTGAPYHMAKAAMNHMTRYHACEWGSWAFGSTPSRPGSFARR